MAVQCQALVDDDTHDTRDTRARALGDSLDLSASAVSEDDALLAAVARAPARPPEPPGLAPGTEVAGRFRIERRIGAGGMGTVYLARDLTLRRDVALKIHRAAAGTARLHREAVAMAQLAHPNVVPVFEVGQVGDRLFVAMEYVPGMTLRAWLAARPRPWREALAILLAAGEGLAAAHDAGLVHRDFKPENVLVGDDGRPRVSDFGLARALGEDGEARSGEVAAAAAPAAATRSGDVGDVGDVAGGSDVSDGLAATVDARGGAPAAATGEPPSLDGSLTMTGAAIGTPAYMAPEQFAARVPDARADQFAFCVVAWDALYGRRPFAGDTFAALRDAVTAGVVRPPPASEVPARVRRLLERGLAVDPAARHPDMRTLLAALREVVPPPRRRGARGAVVLGAVAIAGGVAGATWWAMRPAAAPSCARAGAEVEALLPAAVRDAAVAAARLRRDDDAEHVAHQLARFDARYRAVAVAACEARHVRREWSDELVARSQACLGFRARVARAVAEAAPRAAADVPDFVRTLAELPALAPCGDAVVLAAQPPPIADPARLEAVSTARAALEGALLDLALGRRDRARATIDRVAGLGLDDPAVDATLALARGHLLHEGDQLVEGERLVADAYYDARARGDGELALRALAFLIRSAGAVRYDFAAAAGWIRAGLADAEAERRRNPAGAAGVLSAAGSVAEEQGDAALAAERAAQARALLGDDAPPLALAELLMGEASAAVASGRAADGVALYERALALRVVELGPDHPLVGTTLASLSVALIEADRERDAEAIAARAMEVIRAAREISGTDVATAAHNLAVAHLYTGQWQLAGPLLEDARARFVAALGEDNPTVALADANLALVYQNAGELDRAVAALDRALAVQERVFGPDHVKVATTLYNLAAVQRARGELAASRDVALRCAAIFERTLRGDDRHLYALTMAAMAENLMKEFAAARDHATAALALLGEGSDPQAEAWASLEHAQALIGLRGDVAEIRRLLATARAGYAVARLDTRVTEIDALLAQLPRLP